MNEEKKNDGATKRTEDGTKQASPSISYTEVGSAEFVISGPKVNIQVNKGNVQDFMELYQHAFNQGRTIATDFSQGKAETKDLGEELRTQKEQKDAEDIVKATRTSAFISYSRTDKKYLEELQAHLAPYVRSGIISYWNDTSIKPGAKWFDEIKKNLQSAKIAVFLVSAEFLASDFIASTELPTLLAAANEEGTVILSVILRPCSFKDSELAQFQAINPPSNPLSSMKTRGKRDEVWLKTAESIKDALQLRG